MSVKTLIERLVKVLTGAIDELERSIKEVDEWDGSASRFNTTEDYCAACLINVNTASDPADWTQSHCKLPVREPGDAGGVYVKQALGPAAAALSGARAPLTKPDDVSQDDWDAALKAAANELISAYVEMGEQAPDGVYEVAGKEIPRAVGLGRLSEALWNKLYDTGYWLMDVYVDDDGSLFAVTTSEGKLYRIPFTLEDDEAVLGEPVQVIEEFSDVPRSRTMITRQADGRYRWFSVSNTAVLNRVGEIDSRELFDKFIENSKDHPLPFRTFYHQGEAFRTGQCDFLARDGYALITSGLYDENNWLAQLEIAAREADPDYWGESIGFIPLAREIISVDGIEIPVYTDGVLVEISTLPEEHAAALFTRTSQMEVQRMLTGKALEAFKKLAADAGMDEEAALAWLSENPERANRSIEEGKLIARDADPTAEKNTEPEAVLRAHIEALQKTVNTLVEQVTEFAADTQKRLADLEAAEEVRHRAWLDDLPAQPAINIVRPRQQRADDEEEVVTAAEKAATIFTAKHGKAA